ncbi:GNAT family N-acetyltransferase [Paenibacillus sp. NPDC056579]|uniref:GNAT family N-acetyltransferase n=1 Tax=Paenibacillus sp. NPDC056579 TaxID=3345871 RepID=UPI0036B0A2A9
MLEIRTVRPEEMNDAIALSDAVFRDSEQVSMGTAFPDVFSTSLGQSYGAFDNGKLVSFMGLVPGVIRIGQARVNVYLLGSVCTHTEHRGQGYASQILERIFEHIDKAGASLLLVSGGRSLYTRVHCLPYGQIQRFSLNAESTGQLQDSSGQLTLRELAPTDWLHLHKLAAARTAAFEQSVFDIAKLIQSEAIVSCIKMKHRVVVAQKAGVPVAYAVIAVPNPPYTNKRTPFVVEHAGDAQAIAMLADYARERYGLSEIRVAVSPHETGLLEAMAPFESKTEKNQGTVKIVSLPRLLEQLQPYWQGHPGAAQALQSLSVEALEEDMIRLTVHGQSFTLNPQQVISLVFEGDLPSEADPQAASALSALFPVPFPFTDGLNYV